MISTLQPRPDDNAQRLLWKIAQSIGLLSFGECELPVAPGSLAVSPGNNTNTLTWAAAADATSYNIKRALVTGGPYTTIGTDTASPYVDATAVNGTLYYYVVSSVNDCGESANSTQASGTPAIPENPLATSFAARVVANGGAAISAGTRAALSTFGDALDTAGLTAKMLSVNCIVPDNLIAAITPFIKVKGIDPWTNTNYIAADLSVAGLRDPGNTSYLDTGFVPSTDWPDNNVSGFTYICKSSSGNYPSGFLSTYVSNRVNGINTSGQALFIHAYSNYGNLTRNVPVSAVGKFNWGCCNRYDALLCNHFHGNSTAGFVDLVSGNSAVSGPRPNLSVWMNCRHGAVLFPGVANTYSFAAIHLPLSAAEAQNFFNACVALRAALGGGYA